MDTAESGVPWRSGGEAGLFLRDAEGAWRFWTRAATLAARERAVALLTELGIGSGDVVAVPAALPQAAVLTDAALAVGAAAFAWEGPWPTAPTVVVGRFSDVARALPGSVRQIVLLADPLWSAELLAVLPEWWERAVPYALWYLPSDRPEPVAVGCPRGHLHALDPAAFEPAGGTASAVRLRAPDGRATATLLEPAAGPCERSGPAFSRILTEAPAPVLGGRPIYLADVARALFRTPGFGGAADARVVFDRGRGRGYLTVIVSVKAGADADAVRDAAAYSLEGSLGVTVRCYAEPGLGGLAVTLRDMRVGARG
jgi:hypothetical protein